jgi:amicyanin
MKKSNLVLVVVVVLAIVALGAIFATRQGNNEGGNLTNNEGADPVITETEGAVDELEAQATDRVAISNQAFSPASVTVKTGTTVTWTNQDAEAHNVVSLNDGPLGSELLAQGETYTFTFNEAGTFEYFCEPHPWMRGVVTVED